MGSRELVVLAPPESLQPTTKQRPLLKAALPPSQEVNMRER